MVFKGTIAGTGPLTLQNIGRADGLQLLTPSAYTGATTIGGTSEVLSGVNGAIPTTSDLTVNAGAALDFGASSTVGSLSGAGMVSMLNSSTLTTGGSNASTTYSGTYQASGGGLNKTGSGIFTLAGTSTSCNSWTVDDGTLTLNGTIDSLAVVNSGATLNGTGTAASLSVQSGGTVSGGPSGGIGNLNVGGIAIFAAGSSYAVPLNNNNSSSLTSVSGTTIAGANLNVSLTSSAPVSGTQFTIISASGGVTGMFNGLLNGATFTAGNTKFSITYNPHTVVLTSLGPATGTATALTSSPNPSTLGQQVTLTATVSCSGFMATGTVTFGVDGNPVATQPLSGAPPTAAFKTSSLTVGNHTVTAIYNGDSNCQTSTSNSVQQSVNQAGAGTTLTSSVNPSAPGQPVTFTATVNCPGLTSTGTITFTIDGVAQAPVALSGGTATFTTSSLSPGGHAVTAAYSGDANCAASTSSTLTQSVGASGGSVALVSSQNPSAQGQSVTFTATVGCPNFTPIGTVMFTVDGTAGTPMTVSGNGTATLTTSTLTAGSHTLAAAYSDDANCGPATSTALTQVVSAPPVTEQPVGYGYCYPAANAPPPGAPCTPYTGSGAALPAGPIGAAQICTTVWTALVQQQACIAQALGNVGGYICAIGCNSGGAGAGRAGTLPARLSGAYCTNPDGSRQWVPQGIPQPSGCT
jgi:hypothetical protein